MVAEILLRKFVAFLHLLKRKKRLRPTRVVLEGGGAHLPNSLIYCGSGVVDQLKRDKKRHYVGKNIVYKTNVLHFLMLFVFFKTGNLGWFS